MDKRNRPPTVQQLAALGKIWTEIQRSLPAIQRYLKRQSAKERLRSRALNLGRQARLERLRHDGLPDTKDGWVARLTKLVDQGIPNWIAQDVAEGLLLIMNRDPEAVDWSLWTLSDEPEDVEVIWLVRKYALPYNPDAVKKHRALLDWVLGVTEPPKAKMGRPTEEGRNQEIVLTLLALEKRGVTVVRRDEHDGCELIAKRVGLKHDTVSAIWKRRDKGLAKALKKVL